jgi:hypothetical protein
VIKKFEKLEYLFLDTFRVGLFKIAFNLDETDSHSYFNQIAEDLGGAEAGKKYAHLKTMETKLLSLMCDKLLTPGEPVLKIRQRLPRGGIHQCEAIP